MHKYQRLAKKALNRLKERPDNKIIALLGARQVGKTSLLSDFALEWEGKVVSYLGDKLEDASLWSKGFNNVKNDLEMKIGQSLEKTVDTVLIIFDEIQKVPEAFNNLKILHDQYKSQIKIAISGSSSLSLLQRATESLGGRIEILKMYPLSFAEILNENPSPAWMENSQLNFDQLKEHILVFTKQQTEIEKSLVKAFNYGLFPEAYLQNNIEEVKLLHQNYHQTYVEKDVRDIKEVGNVLDFDLVWKIAHRSNGQLINFSNIARETGLAFNTVKKYISILSASFNISILPPYTYSIRRRLVKSSKIFSVDIGFYNHCLNLYGKSEIESAQLAGGVFESLMIAEFFKQERSFLMGGEPYFFRSTSGAEVDLVVEKGLSLFAYEFKYAKKIYSSDFNGIRSLINSTNNRVKAGFVVSRQPYAEQFAENLYAVPWWFFCLQIN